MEFIIDVKEEKKRIRREYQRQYRKDNPDKIKGYKSKYKELIANDPEKKAKSIEYKKKYEEKNKDRIAEVKRNYRLEHKEELKEYWKNYRREHIDEIKEKSKQYYINNKAKLIEYQITYNAKKKRG